MVVIFMSLAEAAGVRHERTGLPSSSTVHAPHCPSPQPYLVPVMPRRLRSTESRLSLAPASARCSLPLMLNVMLFIRNILVEVRFAGILVLSSCYVDPSPAAAFLLSPRRSDAKSDSGSRISPYGARRRHL